MKHIIDKRTGKSKYDLKDDKRVIMGADVIQLPDTGQVPRVVYHGIGGRKTTYLGGTYICDREFVKNAALLVEKDGKFVEAVPDAKSLEPDATKEIEYMYDDEKEIFVKEE